MMTTDDKVRELAERIRIVTHCDFTDEIRDFALDQQRVGAIEAYLFAAALYKKNCYQQRLLMLKAKKASALEPIPAPGKGWKLPHPSVDALVAAWKTYTETFGQPPHGTRKQIGAMLCFLPREPTK